MRRIEMALMAMAFLLGASMATAVRAETFAAGAAATASQPAAANPVIKASCYRKGWGGWGNYPSCETHVKKKRHRGMHKKK